MLPLLALAAVSLEAAFLLRFEFTLPPDQRRLLELGFFIFVPFKLVAFYFFGLHRAWWRIVGLFDLVRIGLANLSGSAAATAVCLISIGPEFPRSVYILDAILCFLLTAALQFSYRIITEVIRARAADFDSQKTIFIYGAGSAGLTLAREIRSNPRLNTRVAGFLDDDARKHHSSVLGIPVLGSGRDAARLTERARRRRNSVSEIVIAMPSASGRQMRTAIANCRAAGVPFKTVPGLGELLDGKVLSSQLRDVSVNDLLGREPVRIDETVIREATAGKSVLVTGGCGSIGSEICRQVARFGPRALVIFDRAESDLFMLALDLRSRFPSLNLVTELGDITRPHRISEAIRAHSIDVVFHAAAYKHVPLMEANILEAVENNVIGTYNVAQAAHQHNVQRFVMISSDKAVNPTSIMGLTKRVAELIVSAMPLDGSPRRSTFVSVRFGNVLASAGSVVQIFQRQIAQGGPVTVTHPQMCRYFMSIPEAVQLVLQASAMGKGSEVFVLDMGEPVRIVDLATNMIRLAGLVPGEDIEILFTGPRPGEKLFEELQLAGEDIVPTYHEKIKIFKSRGRAPAQLAQWLEALQFMLKARRVEDAKAHLAGLVPAYHPEEIAPVELKREVAHASR
ncbi:MAG TPA: nucleoside-diphosphate sugar epimerase/dehydratase [Bryobacteraceae bacterium]|nr:nucleoside-diphosphate sugar epimerase/dehydratase [Bryobacteraceae bacterium]